ncbi:MAG: rhodanese [Planctomycetia bacterium]|nr:rhodanese [Planctomycetia bacterium]
MSDSPAIEISAAEAAAELRRTPPSAALLLLDCRTAEEHATARIAGSLLLPMQELPERMAELSAWKDKPIIVHCHHGMRSLRVAKWLREQGFFLAQSMQGGIDAWSTDVDPAVPRY